MADLTKDIIQLFENYAYDEVKMFIDKLPIPVSDSIFNIAWQNFKKQNKN